MLRQLYGSRELRRWTLILYWIAMFVATHWPDINRYKPEAGWPIPYFGAVMHATVYAVWAGLWWWFLSTGRRQVRRAAAVWLLVGGVLWASFDELSQALVAREPAIDDFLCDLCGMLLVVFILLLRQGSQVAVR